MYNIYPYTTNDGSVGLYSSEDNDVYHSAYGALTEAWDKFTIPSKLSDKFATQDEVRLLDICYGIGYNSKTALQSYINYLKNKNSDNNFLKKIFKKNNINIHNNIAPIYTDNISNKNKKNICEKNIEILKNNSIMNSDKQYCSETIYTDNICETKFIIDAVDSDETLMKLSPFIKTQCKFYKATPTDNKKLLQVKNLQNKKHCKLNPEYKISNEINIFLIHELFRNFGDIFSSNNLSNILSKSDNLKFIDKNMLNFAKLYSNRGYETNKTTIKSTFLHNIYYRYISYSDKMIEKCLKNDLINLHFHSDDARKFILSTTNNYDIIFLDAFTPTLCPCLWSENFIKQLYNHLTDDGVVLTYSTSAAVRNAFLKNNFYVGKTYDKISKKIIGTVAAKNKDSIEFPLDEKDIALINSKAGITFKDLDLIQNNDIIIKNRAIEFEQSSLQSSTKALKRFKDAK